MGGVVGIRINLQVWWVWSTAIDLTGVSLQLKLGNLVGWLRHCVGRSARGHLLVPSIFMNTEKFVIRKKKFF